MKFNIQNSFIENLPADSSMENISRQVKNACFSYVNPKIPIKPKLIHYSNVLATELGLTDADTKSLDFLDVFSGSKIYENTKPYAMCYAGHQFGHWAGQLGDGRAINLFEHIHNEKRFALQLKGAGPTPYSRNADGFAVLRSSIREHLCSEVMHFLGIPTTRSLSLMLTGDEVMRDMLYDGHPENEKGAIVCRIAPSFIRFGSFEALAVQNDKENLQKLADYTICHFYSHIGETGKEGYVQFFKEVAERTMNLILDWQRVGFVHGVMNTDNMSILGQTIDYGPYGWLEGYDPNWTPNTTDAQGKRYRYGAQPEIALWNLVKLANAIYSLIEDVKPLEEILENTYKNWIPSYYKMMASKLGLSVVNSNATALIDSLENCLELIETDMIIFYRNLANIKKQESKPEECLDMISNAFYNMDELNDKNRKIWMTWFGDYLFALKSEQVLDSKRKENMNAINPKYVLRNYMAQLAIDDANKGDYNLIDELYTILEKPYDEQPKYEKWFAKRPEWARNKVGCSMLSCSS